MATMVTSEPANLPLPQKPLPPDEFVDDYIRAEVTGRNITLKEVMDELETKVGRPLLLQDVIVDIERGYENADDEVEFTVCKTVGKKPNPSLDLQRKDYERRLQIYEADLASYAARNTVYKQRLAEEAEKLRGKQISEAISVMNRYKMSHKYLGD